MESDRTEQLRPRLEEAQETLKETLEEACRAEVYGADTGELIRIEEMLALADEAAKEAIALRRQLRTDDESRDDDEIVPPRITSFADATLNKPAPAHRSFSDAGGMRWELRAIYPTTASGRARLPEPYESGWLSFESPTEKRRLSPIPDGWRSCDENELRQLCGQAEIVPKRLTQTDLRNSLRSGEPLAE